MIDKSIKTGDEVIFIGWTPSDPPLDKSDIPLGIGRITNPKGIFKENRIRVIAEFPEGRRRLSYYFDELALHIPGVEDTEILL